MFLCSQLWQLTETTELKSPRGALGLGVSGGDEALVFSGTRSRGGLGRIAWGSGEPGCPWE